MFGCSGFLMLKWLTITTVYVSVFSVWYLVLVVVADRFLKIMLIKKQLQLLSDLLFQYVRVWSIKKGQFIRKGTMKSHSLNSPKLVVSFCMVVTRVKLKQYHNWKICYAWTLFVSVTECFTNRVGFNFGFVGACGIWRIFRLKKRLYSIKIKTNYVCLWFSFNFSQ